MPTRKLILAANWKMNKGPAETEDFLKSFLQKLQEEKSLPCEIVIAPPFVSLAKAAEMLSASNAPVQLAAQNASQYDAGAYTGETTMLMLKEFFVSDETINAKLKKAREANLKPIFCIGETLAEREGGKLEEVLGRQITVGLDGLTEKDMLDTVIAYEPVWAIGTGVTATTEQAQQAHAFVRGLVAKMFGQDVADKVRIQYGGSVKPANAAELMACPDIDGALVGGAALDPQSFFDLISNACTVVEE